MKASVLGAGAMGGAMALNLHRAGNLVALCATKFDASIIDAIRKSRTHPLLGSFFPDEIALVSADSWDETVESSDIIVVAVASAGVADVVQKAATMMKPEAVVVVASKGWEEKTARPLSKVVAEAAPGRRVVVCVGPSLAKEMAEGVPTALVCASSDAEAASLAARALGGASISTYVSDDVAGVEVGSALKNVLAIGIGMCDGIAEAKGRSMTNTKAALFSRGLVEMGRLATSMGGRTETVLGLAGAGDLFVTVLGGRNGRFGRLVGAGLEPQKAFDEMGTTVEGYENTSEARSLASKMSLELPVVEMVYRVLFEGADPDEAVRGLLADAARPEI